MTTFVCLKDCGLFKQGRTYSFDQPTAQALSAARGGFLKPLATGGIVADMPLIGQEPTALVVPRKRGRPKKADS